MLKPPLTGEDDSSCMTYAMHPKRTRVADQQLHNFPSRYLSNECDLVPSLVRRSITQTRVPSSKDTGLLTHHPRTGWYDIDVAS